MKSIVEETTKSLTLNQGNTASKKVESTSTFLESSVNMYSEDTRIAKNYETCHEDLALKNIAFKNIKQTQAVAVDCESENGTNSTTILNNEKQNYNLKIISKCPADDKGSEKKKLETTEICNNRNFKIIAEPSITTRNLLDIDNLKVTNSETCSLNILESPISLLDKDRIRPGYEDAPDTEQIKVNQATVKTVKTKTNVSVIKQLTNDKLNLNQKCLQRTKNDVQSIVTLEKNQQASLCYINTQKNKQKTNVEVTKRTKRNTAIKEINNSAQVKPVLEKKKKCVTKNGANKESIKNTTQGRNPKIIPGNSTINLKIPNNIKHTKVHIRNDEVSITAWNENSHENIISQLDLLTNSKRVENDLSWLENIKYVREISANEFDPKLNGLEDNFWDNFSLPGEWSDVEFLY
ncbi:uncharacterized protein [Epargyreus clarus]